MISGSSASALNLLTHEDVAVAITHAPKLEAEFLVSNPGSASTPFMYNEFVLVGPADDPSAVRGSNLADAFAHIAQRKQQFISRADRSGTHLAEMMIWRQLDLQEKLADDWYKQAGNSMSTTLLLAEQLQAYTLSDSATLAFLRARRNLTLEVLAQNTPPLRNTYNVLLTGRAGDELALQFANWLSSAQGKAVIAGYRQDNKMLFTPLP